MSLLHRALLALTLATFPATQLLIAQAPGPAKQSREHTGERAAIEKVMADFHAAVVAHDGQRIAALSVPEGSTWFNVLSDEALTAAKLKNPAVKKVRHSSFEEFAKFVSSSTAALNPQHTNIQIQTDGTVASVYFDYVFLIDSKAQNKGCETWQLINTPDGWKIVAISYSSNPGA